MLTVTFHVLMVIFFGRSPLMKWIASDTTEFDLENKGSDLHSYQRKRYIVALTSFLAHKRAPGRVCYSWEMGLPWTLGHPQLQVHKIFEKNLPFTDVLSRGLRGRCYTAYHPGNPLQNLLYLLRLIFLGTCSLPKLQQHPSDRTVPPCSP